MDDSKMEMIELKGFLGDKVVITKEEDYRKDHDHLLIEINGNKVGYLHISWQSIILHNPLTEPATVQPDLLDLRTLRGCPS